MSETKGNGKAPKWGKEFAMTRQEKRPLFIKHVGACLSQQSSMSRTRSMHLPTLIVHLKVSAKS